ncbi:hypothetical protein M0805_005843 [Coniferiporia weirii]|nr:hypothetical protein M0805_005843 [Coniferiporia weirii]
MAKPLPPSPTPSPPVLLSLSPPRRRRRRSARPNPAAPSAGLLAVLAAVVGASTSTAAPAVARTLTSDPACPADPGVADFLCPALHASRSASASASASASIPRLPAPSAAAAIATASSSSSATAAATTLFHLDRETASAPPPQPHRGAEPWPCPRPASSSDFYTHGAARARVPLERPPQSLFQLGWSTKRNRAGRKIRRDADSDSDGDNDADSDDDGDDYDDFYYPLRSRTIPDRYELGVDGRWHKVSFWSSCPRCKSDDIDDSASNSASTSADTGVSADDLEASASISTLTTSSTYSPSATSTESPVYPDGWASGGNDTGVYKVAVIAVASVLLAAAITCAIATTLLWRRRSRAAHAAARRRDLERRRKKKNDSDSGEDESDDEGRGYEYTRETREGAGLRRERNRSRRSLRDAEERDENSAEEKTKAKWARAAARWKAHARWIHRRRRGRSSIVENLMQRDGANTASAAASGVSLAAASALSSKSSARVAPSLANVNATGVVGQPETEVERVETREEGRSSASYRYAPASGDRHNRHTDQASGPDLGRTSSRRPELVASTSRLGNTGDHDDGENGDGARASTHIEYDRPPPAADLDDLGLPIPLPIPVSLDDEAQALGPPAYRSWRRPIRRDVGGNGDGDGGGDVENRARRARRDEKRAVGAAPVYVSAGGLDSQSRDADVLGSDEDGWYDDYGPEDGGEDSGTGRRPVLHVATDDKHMLARLAASASAPPPPLFPASPTGAAINVPSQPPPRLDNHPISLPFSAPSSSAPPFTRSTVPILMPHAPAWHDLEEAFEDSASDAYDTGSDSPGAGPGPSTATAWRASLASRPQSPHAFDPPTSPYPSHGRSSPRTHSPHTRSPRNRLPRVVDSPFPAPPAPVPSSALTYASLPSGGEDGDFAFFPPPSVGYEADEVVGEPSAPPFTPWPETEDVEAVIDVLLGASAPPLFDDEESYAHVHTDSGYSDLEYARPDYEVGANEEGVGDGDGVTAPEPAPPPSMLPATVEQGTDGAANTGSYS